MNYQELRKQTNQGWNTWDTSSVLSHVLLPYGFAIRLVLKDHAREHVLRNPLIGRMKEPTDRCDPEIITPMHRSWDGRYTALKVEYGETVFQVETTARDGEEYILVTPEKAGKQTPALVVEACLLWGREGTLSKKDGKLSVSLPDGKEIQVHISKEGYALPNTYSLSPCVAVDLDEPVVISTAPCTTQEVRSYLQQARQELEEQAASYGKNQETYTAMKSCLAWNSIYDPEWDRIISPVSRLWNIDWGGYVLFHWDSFYAALMASVDCPELAWLNAIAIMNERTEKGFIPNFGASFDYKTRDRSQPPVGSMVVMEIYKRWGGKWFLEELYDKFMKQNQWFFENRSTEEGYMCWGSNACETPNRRRFEGRSQACRQGAAFESGLDNSPMYDGMEFDDSTGLLKLADVGLMGLFIKDCNCLAEMARELGREEDLSVLARRKEKVEKALSTMYSPEDGMFLNIDLRDHSFSRRVSPTNFYSLYSSVVTQEQKAAMLEKWFYNPEKFWGEYIIPSITRDDPAYKDQDYWRGRIWAPMNLLVYYAFRDSGLDKEAVVLAEKSKALILKEWREHGHVHENYNGTTGEGCDSRNSDRFYHWGGLLSYLAMDADV